MTARAPRSDTEIQVRWWVLALPALAFAALLALQVAGAEARAAGDRQPVTELVDHVWQSWLS
ncbi:hypothetical protein [Streptomyces sp. NBC_01803]|uniref:hypothetical protein n=1 Tax=Streptomyces sp. NBC_01803 TaxID=2975946 RepID=UPI002DD99C28|nr:hypothetical protein [Streptomyces sp. NBC_01803]WSA46860.1 hypothetical protein OIE51_23350 [Streptomyces sp. NBC_01803]